MPSGIVANGQWHGGAMWLAPDAKPDDGLFDIVLIGDITKVDLLRSRAVTVDAPERLPIELDGEQVGTTPVRFEIVPGALRIRVPA